MMIEWLAEQINEDAQPYYLEDDMRPLIFDEDETVRERARFAAEKVYFRSHFEEENETCPLLVVDEKHGVIFAAAVNKELGMIVKHWFCDDELFPAGATPLFQFAGCESVS